jgi:ankyrin repeat protein
MFAAAKGYTEIVEILITNGGDVNARDKDSWSALTFAIKYNHTEINRLLEQAGAEFFVPYNI